MINDLGGDLAALLGGRQDIDTHLVLTATARQSDLERRGQALPNVPAFAPDLHQTG